MLAKRTALAICVLWCLQMCCYKQALPTFSTKTPADASSKLRWTCNIFSSPSQVFQFSQAFLTQDVESFKYPSLPDMIAIVLSCQIKRWNHKPKRGTLTNLCIRSSAFGWEKLMHSLHSERHSFPWSQLSNPFVRAPLLCLLLWGKPFPYRSKKFQMRSDRNLWGPKWLPHEKKIMGYVLSGLRSICQVALRGAVCYKEFRIDCLSH